MRKNVKKLIKGFAEKFEIQEPIIEIGSFLVEGQEELADLRPLFKGKKYIGCDMRPGPGVDRIEDVEKLKFDDNSVGSVIMADTLEHVKNPFNAIKEINRVLKPGGFLIMSSVMNFPIHDYPSDYWRFTPEAFRFLTNSFEFSFIDFDGSDNYPHTIIAIAVKEREGRSIIINPENIKSIKWKTEETNIKQKIKLFIPPIALSFFVDLKRLILLEKK